MTSQEDKDDYMRYSMPTIAAIKRGDKAGIKGRVLTGREAEALIENDGDDLRDLRPRSHVEDELVWWMLSDE